MSSGLSVGIANYNHAHYLPVVLEGIISQSVLPDEIIIIDDKSTDDSLEVIDSFARRCPLIKVIANARNLGVLENMRCLLAQASGQYYFAASADDGVLPGFFESSLRLLDAYPQAGLCSSRVRVIDEHGSDCGVLGEDPFRAEGVGTFVTRERAKRELYRRGSWIRGCATIYRRTALLSVGSFRAELGSFSDGYAQQVIAVSHGVCFIGQPLALRRAHTSSFATQTAFDPVQKRAVQEAVARIAACEHSEWITPQYLSRSEHRWDFAVVAALVRTEIGSCREALRQFLPPPEGLVIAMRWAAMRVLDLVEWSLVFSALLLRWFDLGVLVRSRVGRWMARTADSSASKNPSV